MGYRRRWGQLFPSELMQGGCWLLWFSCASSHIPLWSVCSWQKSPSSLRNMSVVPFISHVLFHACLNFLGCMRLHLMEILTMSWTTLYLSFWGHLGVITGSRGCSWANGWWGDGLWLRLSGCFWEQSASDVTAGKCIHLSVIWGMLVSSVGCVYMCLKGLFSLDCYHFCYEILLV